MIDHDHHDDDHHDRHDNHHDDHHEPIVSNGPRPATVLRAIAVFGVVVGVVLGGTAWIFLGDLDRNLDQSLAIGESASGSVIETIDVADRLIDSLDQGLGTVGATLAAVESTLDDTSGVAATTASLSATLPESFDDIDAALSTVETLSTAIDAALGGLSRVPFGPDYDPDIPLPDAIGNLRAAFAPIGEDLRSISTELQSFADGSDEVGVQIETVRSDLAETRAALIASSRLLDDYRETAQEAGLLASTSREDTAQGFALARIGLLLLAAFVIVAQYIPWWLAGTVAARGGPTQVSASGPSGTDDRPPEIDRHAVTGGRGEHDDDRTI